MTLPEGFCDLKELVPDAVMDIWYATDHNLTGKPLSGYGANRALGSMPMGRALEKAACDARTLGYHFIIFDAYRPQKAVDDFVAWAGKREDGKTKAEFYPRIPKEQLFELGYIARKSGHSRGSTVDLTLANAHDSLDMGTHFDFMDVLSHHGASGLSAEQARNRDLLKRIMEMNGFVTYENEWWHYRLRREPYSQTYFDFDIL